MGHGVHAQDLPGIGRRYDLDLGRTSERVSVVVRYDRTRDLYLFTGRSAEPTAAVELSEEQARKLGALLAGTFYED
jgi:TrkA domain protein